MIIKNLPEKFKFLVKDQDDTFRLYVDRKEIGQKVLNSLEERRNGFDAIGNPAEGFYLSSRNKEIGLNGQLYGGNALFTLMNRFGVEASDSVKEQMVDCVRYVLRYLEENNGCYDLNPILDQDLNNELFLDKENNYIGAMTWALSLFTAARTSQRKGLLEFSEEETKQIFARVKEIIKFFVLSVVGTEEQPLGWGYTNDCTEPSLFFTYSVIEAFADFDDNVLNGGALGPDEELLAFINATKNAEEVAEEDKLTTRYQSICFKLGDRAWAMYKKILKVKFFSDNFSPNYKVISKEEILNSSRSSVLFNTLYVIYILFYTYTNLRNEAEKEDIIDSITLALQMIENFYDDLRMVGKESIVDRHIIAFDQPHKEIKDFGKLLNEESIQASPFLPMLVKANNLVAFYILKFPQQQMREFFDMMLEAQMEGKNDWVWDQRKYDLLSTERYLEAIADFFDYYDRFERNYADKSTTDARRKREITEEITPGIERKVEKKLEVAHKKDMELLRKNMEQEYPIESLINKRINNTIEERALEMVMETMEKMIEYNTAPQKQKWAIEESFTDGQKRFKDTLEKLVLSYFADDVRVKARAANEMSEEVLAEAVKSDMEKFMSSFVEFIAYNNVNRPEEKKLSIADVFKMLEREN